MKITAQYHIIQSTLDALETKNIGMRLKKKCEIKYQLFGKTPWIELIQKENHCLNSQDMFWLGFFAREHLDE